MYVSRIDGDVVTYDIRMKVPNGGDYLSNGVMHTIEHFLATYMRNSRYKNSVVYVGPMGCRTGFYLLMRDDVSRGEALELVRDSFNFIAGYDEKEVPGAESSRECGNYLEHDLDGAIKEAIYMSIVLREITEEDMKYE